jgi:hypothetical protein
MRTIGSIAIRPNVVNYHKNAETRTYSMVIDIETAPAEARIDRDRPELSIVMPA